MLQLLITLLTILASPSAATSDGTPPGGNSFYTFTFANGEVWTASVADPTKSNKPEKGKITGADGHPHNCVAVYYQADDKVVIEVFDFEVSIHVFTPKASGGSAVKTPDNVSGTWTKS